MDGSTWEFEKGLELPHHLQVSCEYTYIGKYLPNAVGKHFELNWLKDTNTPNGSGTFPTQNASQYDNPFRQKYNYLDGEGITINGKSPKNWFSEQWGNTKTDESK